MNSQQAINLLNGLEQRLDDYCELNNEGKAAFRMAITALELFGNAEELPSAQPEQRWIPVSERLPEEFPCLASDSWGQMWIPVGVVTINNRCFDGKDFEFDVEKFFKGKEVTMRNGVKVRVLPREIVAWMPLPEPYKAESEG